jgi:hypothetical protein
MVTKEKTANRKKRVQSLYKNIEEFSIPNLEIKRARKIYDRSSRESNVTLYQERNRIIEKGTKIIAPIFIVSLIYFLGFLLKYCQLTRFESIILSLISSSIFTCKVGPVIGKYLVQRSNNKHQKELDN